jgi:hypothetical protein
MDTHPLAVSPTRDLRYLQEFLLGLVLIELDLARQIAHSLLELREKTGHRLWHFMRSGALYVTHANTHVLEARMIFAAARAQKALIIHADVAQTREAVLVPFGYK